MFQRYIYQRIKTLLIRLFLCPIFIIALQPGISAGETYRYEGMWPRLPQPWYFSYPRGLAVDKKGYIYVSDNLNHKVHRFNWDGAFITAWGIEGSGDGEFKNPTGIAVDKDGNIYVADTRNHRIQKFSIAGVFISQWGGQGSENSQFENPCGITVDKDGNIYVADTDNHRVQKFSTSGEFITAWGSHGSENGQFDLPFGIEVFTRSRES